MISLVLSKSWGSPTKQNRKVLASMGLTFNVGRRQMVN